MGATTAGAPFAGAATARRYSSELAGSSLKPISKVHSEIVIYN